MLQVDIEGTFFDLDQYELTDKILGSGSFGKVQIVRKISDNTLYAAKIISLKKNVDTRFQVSFMRESLLMKSLSHPAIVSFYGMSFNSFEHRNKLEPTILMEYLKNDSLDTILENEKKGTAPYEWTNAKKYICLIGVSHAMNHLHQKKIIHRDLKPGNVLMDDDLYPRVSDFGLSRCFHEDESTELSKTAFVGTPKYMAPELLQYQKNYSPSVDVYAFGVMAYEIVTGHDPYSKNGEELTFHSILKKVIFNKEVPEFPEDVTIQMRCLINSCMSPDSEDRPSFEFIYNQLTSPELDFLDVQESDKNEILNYIEILQAGTDVKVSKGPQKVTEISDSMDTNNSPKPSSLNDISLSNPSISPVSLSTMGSKYGIVLNQECESINKKFNDERKSYAKIVKSLLPKRRDKNKKDKKGNTILHLACRTGNIALVKKILLHVISKTI